MLKRIFVISVLTTLSMVLYGQNYRTIDGSENNQSNPSWGAAGEQFIRITSYGYEDGFSTPGGSNLTNPRIISNELFAQDSAVNDALNLSDFVWVFGQFTDHDLTLVHNDPTEPVSIPVNFEDEYFNPGGLFPNVQIHMSRSLAASGTGTDLTNPREHKNEITSWIDASNVYGSDIERANWLRTFVDGKLKTSIGNLLPYNTTNGEYDAPIDPNAPGMDNENPFVSKLFVGGDSRTNENALLTCFHTVFVREHNRYCDILKVEHPTWIEEQLYREARKRVNAHIQAITYEEWLPAMGIELEPYTAYDASVNPTISNVFSAAAFRLGHTLLNGSLKTIDNDGNFLEYIALKDAFFTPSLVADLGLDPFLKGMAEQVEQEMDAMVVDDVRNFLFGPPTSGVGGLDLAAINIQRGRERGIPPFNTVREDLGLLPYANLDAFSSNPLITAILEEQYYNVNNIDAWVGMLCEEHMPGALFGETIMHIMMDQFQALRDGDRFYYENAIDNNFTLEEVNDFKTTTFRDIIMRNTDVSIMQENVFEAMPHDSICMASGGTADINGAIESWNGLNVEGVEMIGTNVADNSSITTLSTPNGTFLLEEAESCEHYLVSPSKNTNHRNGVTTNDLIKVIRHILQVETLDTPYKIIAADANNNGDVSLTDAIAIRRLILFIDNEYSNNTSWRFVDANYTFSDPTQPLGEDFPEAIDVGSAGDLLENLNFVAVKIGDVNGTANPNLLIDNESDTKTDERLLFNIIDQTIKAGEVIQLPIRSSQITSFAGFQFAIQLDQNALTFDAIYPHRLPSLSASNFNYIESEGQLLMSWDGDASNLLRDEILFTLQLEAKKDGQLSDFIGLNTSRISAEAYPSSNIDEAITVDLTFEKADKNVHLANDFVLLQNQPNPFKDQTIIGFTLPESSEVSLTITDMTGRLVYTTTGDFSKGYQQFEIDPTMISTGGSVLYYEVATPFGTSTRKMTVAN